MIKKFILWLANVSGVSKEIETKHQINIGHNLFQASHWLTSDDRVKAGNALAIVGSGLVNDLIINPSKLRDLIDEYGDTSYHKSKYPNTK
jgi:hypothetical protein